MPLFLRDVSYFWWLGFSPFFIVSLCNFAPFHTFHFHDNAYLATTQPHHNYYKSISSALMLYFCLTHFDNWYCISRCCGCHSQWYYSPHLYQGLVSFSIRHSWRIYFSHFAELFFEGLLSRLPLATVIVRPLRRTANTSRLLQTWYGWLPSCHIISIRAMKHDCQNGHEIPFVLPLYFAFAGAGYRAISANLYTRFDALPRGFSWWKILPSCNGRHTRYRHTRLLSIYRWWNTTIPYILMMIIKDI